MITNKNFYLLFIVILMPLTGFGIDIYTPAFPAIANQLGVSNSAVKMTVSLYLLGLCVGQIIFGILSDGHGRKSTLLIGCLGFMITSILIPLLPNIYFIMACRIVQGFFVGSVAVNCRSVVADVFNKDEIKIVSTYMSMAWSLGPIIAPLIGAYLQFYFSWHSNFYFLAGYALLMGLVIIFFLSETNQHRTKPSLLGVIADYFTILKHRQFMGALILLSMGYAMLVIFPLISPFLVQEVFHKSPIVYGRLALCVGLFYLAGTIINRLLLKKFTPDTLIKFGLYSLVALNLFLLLIALLFPNTLWTLYGPMFLITMSISLVFPNCLGKSISHFPQMAGKAGAVVGTGFMFLTAIISVVTNYLPLHSQFAIGATFLLFSCVGLVARKML